MKGRKVWKGVGGFGSVSPPPFLPFTSGVASLAMKNGKVGNVHGRNGDGVSRDSCSYRAQLEQEVENLQKELQEEINLHTALVNAVGHNNIHLLPSFNLPNKVHKLLSSVASLEIAVSRLEEDLISLHCRLNQERNVCHFGECHLINSPVLSHTSQACSPCYTGEEKLSPSVTSQDTQAFCFSQQELECGHSPSSKTNIIHSCSVRNKDLGQKVSKLSNSSIKELEADGSLNADAVDLDIAFLSNDLWSYPNRLSEEMVRCMRNIFLGLSESPSFSSKSRLYCLSSPVGHLSCSSLTSFSGSPIVPSPSTCPAELHLYCDDIASQSTFDPYSVCWKENKSSIGIYGLATEVSWMTVGKKQLEYAAKALKKFRFLVEQLAEVDPANMSNNEKLAFWINLYNALVMHAYLAYGAPKSDMRFFSLMQKVSYTIGGHSLSAADIEYVILKSKPPVHRPQIALMLTHHKFKLHDGIIDFGIEAPEPLAAFALSCGMYSSPAVRIFSADGINRELQNSLKDYVRASVGINDKGKLVVPKLLHCFAQGVVEDSLLVDWICRFLSPQQVSLIRDSTSRKQRLLGARSFSVVPFDSRFRYIFLPENKCLRNPS